MESSYSNYVKIIEIQAYSNGIFNDSDRRMLAFSGQGVPIIYPMNLLKISNNSKFSTLFIKII